MDIKRFLSETSLTWEQGLFDR